MRNFKFLKTEEEAAIINLNDYWETRTEVPIFNDDRRMLTFRPNVENVNNEFCFQFDDEEPQVFAVGNNRLTIEIPPNDNGSIIFNKNGRVFKIFARERQ